jgi:hypothetical protein
MPGFGWRMPMDIPWCPKAMDFKRRQETRKKTSCTSCLFLFNIPLVWCVPTPVEAFHEKLAFVCVYETEYPMKIIFQHYKMHVEKNQVNDIGQNPENFKCLCSHQDVYKMSLPQPIVYFPSVFQKGRFKT